MILLSSLPERVLSRRGRDFWLFYIPSTYQWRRYRDAVDSFVNQLVRQGGGVQIVVRSDLTGEKVSSGALIPPEGKWDVQSIIEDFVEDTESFVESYFGKGESPKRRIIDYNDVLNEMRTLLRKISKK